MKKITIIIFYYSVFVGSLLLNSSNVVTPALGVVERHVRLEFVSISMNQQY